MTDNKTNLKSHLHALLAVNICTKENGVPFPIALKRRKCEDLAETK